MQRRRKSPTRYTTSILRWCGGFWILPPAGSINALLQWAGLFGVVEVEAGFDTVEPCIHLRLHGLAPQIVAAQIVDVLPHLNYLARMIGLILDNARLPGLKLLQHLEYQFIGDGIGHARDCSTDGLTINIW